MIDPAKVGIRVGTDRRYLNIDYDSLEVGWLRLAEDRTIDRSWAHHVANRPLIDMTARLIAAAHAAR